MVEATGHGTTLMLHASTQQLIRKLCELTEEGAIAWKEGDAGASVFETEGYLVEVREAPPGVRLLRQDGRELERADAADLAAPWPGGEGTYASSVAVMANHAGRIARGAETAIAKILSSLSAPPKKAAEPEPEPAALAFDPPAIRAPSPEGATAIAAVSANLDAQRSLPAIDPPVSHTLPEPAPVTLAPETETAIDRVLAVQPAPQPDPVIRGEPAPAPIVTLAAEPELQSEPEPEPASATPPILIDPGVVEAAPSQPELAPAASQAAIEPEPAPEPPVVAAEPPPAPASLPHRGPKAGFGAIDGFTRTPLAPPPPPEPSKVTSTGLLMRGFSARTSQTVEPSIARDYMRSASPEPQPKPAPGPEKQLEPAAANGADIYKPWA